MSLAKATAVRPIGDAKYEGSIEHGWDIAGNANGGYLMAIAARAAAEAAGCRTPISLTAHFLAPGKPGPVTIDTTAEKQGRRFTTVTARLHDSDRPLMTLLGSYAASPPKPSRLGFRPEVCREFECWSPGNGQAGVEDGRRECVDRHDHAEGVDGLVVS